MSIDSDTSVDDLFVSKEKQSSSIGSVFHNLLYFNNDITALFFDRLIDKYELEIRDATVEIAAAGGLRELVVSLNSLKNKDKQVEIIINTTVEALKRSDKDRKNHVGLINSLIEEPNINRILKEESVRVVDRLVKRRVGYYNLNTDDSRKLLGVVDAADLVNRVIKVLPVPLRQENPINQFLLLVELKLINKEEDHYKEFVDLANRNYEKLFTNGKDSKVGYVDKSEFEVRLIKHSADMIKVNSAKRVKL